MLIQSAKLSPTVVHRILMTQNHTVISGTLLSIERADSIAVGFVISLMSPEGICRSLKAR
jgi:hypothetical protein